MTHDALQSQYFAPKYFTVHIHRLKWRHISVVAVRSPFCRSKRCTVCS